MKCEDIFINQSRSVQFDEYIALGNVGRWCVSSRVTLHALDRTQKANEDELKFGAYYI